MFRLILIAALALALIPAMALAEREPLPPADPDDDAAFVAWIEAKAEYRNERGGRATLTPEERAYVAAKLRTGCDTFGFSAEATQWLRLQGYCAEPDEPTPRPE